MNVIIETERLLLRTFTMDDAQLLYDLNLDPEVTKYTYDPMKDVDHAREVLEQIILSQYALYNHGRWAVHTKHALEFIGWSLLKTMQERNNIEFGHSFIKNVWGQRYATE